MIYIGTSGFQYAEWLGSFYPEKLSKAKMLAFYATQFSSTEINYTFQRLPSPETLQRWSAATPDGFKFAFKAPRWITHASGLRDREESLQKFALALAPIGVKKGPVLFQLPPSFKKDVPALTGFLAGMPETIRPAFEFRHKSWHDEEVFEALRRHGAALCIADAETLTTPPIATAPFGYFRLRREDYTPAVLRKWAKVLQEHAQTCPEVFVYFKHEDTAVGTRFAKTMLELLA